VADQAKVASAPRTADGLGLGYRKCPCGRIHASRAAGGDPCDHDARARSALAVSHDAETLPEAKAAAAGARGFVVGPDGPRYGDADGTGDIQNAHDVELLRGLCGEPGIAPDTTVNGCVEADVPGGS
jgi:hypothetical protein